MTLNGYTRSWTLRGFLQPTRLLQGGQNGESNFHAKMEPLFSKIRDNLKA